MLGRMSRALLLIAALLGSACTAESASSDSTAAQPAATSTAEKNTPPTSAPAAMVVTANGIGPVRAGMTIAELRQALDSVHFTDPDSMRCAYPRFVGLPDGVWVMVEQGIVGRVDVQKGDVPTAEGVRIGDDSAKVRSVYGSHVTSMPHKYTDGRYLEVRSPSDTMHMIIFETNVAGEVLRYRAGQLPQVRYVESCS